MDEKLTRRALLRTLAGGAVATAGVVTLARTSLANVPESPVDAATRPVSMFRRGPRSLE